MMSFKKLFHITGPTSSGKTLLAIKLGKRLNAQIVSCDSRQFFKEMKIGTAVPSEIQLSQCVHHFIQHKSITDDYNVGKYQKDAIFLLKKLFKDNQYLILVGGSGLYADSVIYGLDDFPEPIPEIKKELREILKTKGLVYLRNLLKEKDYKYYKYVDLNNTHRIIRALEVCFSSNLPYSSFIGNKKSPDFFKTATIRINIERKTLYEKINKKIDQMILDGLENEVRFLSHYKSLNSMQTVGYKEWFAYWENLSSYQETVELIKKNTRRFAKRQITWNKKYLNAINYTHDQNIDNIIDLLNKTVTKS